MDPRELLLLGLTALLIALNGFFVAAEFALVKLRLTRAEELAEEHGLVGRALLAVRGNLDPYLSACQLGITVASIALGVVAEPLFAGWLEPPLGLLGLDSPAVVHGVATGGAIAFITFLHVVLGEQAPKLLAIRKSEQTSLVSALPLVAFYWLTWPFIWVLNATSTGILKLLKVDLDAEGDEAHSAEELRHLLAASHLHGEIDQEEVDILQRTLNFSDLAVGDLMRPASEMATLDLTTTLAENLAVIEQHHYSRFPVCEGDRDNVVGLVHVKDLFAAQRRGESLELRALMRDLPTVHRDTKAFELLRMFRQGAPHFAVVDDDLGTVTGFVTLDHLLEALVGQIQDEFRRASSAWTQLKDGSWVGDGKLSLYSLEQVLGREIDVDEVDSIGGLVMWKLERVPQKGDRVAFEGFDVVVNQMQGPRVSQVQVIPRPA